MSPSLQNVPTNIKLPLSSSGRFNIKTRIRNRLRTLTADLKGILEDGFRDVKLSLSDDVASHPRLYRKGSHNTSEKSVKCATSAGYHDDGCILKEMSLSTEGKEPPGSRPGTAGVCAAASEPEQNNPRNPQAPLIDSPNIEFLGGCPLKVSLSNEVAHALPDLAGLVGDDAFENSRDSGQVQYPSSPVGSDVLTALDDFDANEEALSYSDSSYAGPMRSLQTIYEEVSTMFNSFYSADPVEEAVEITRPFPDTVYENNSGYNSDRSECRPSPTPSSCPLRLASSTVATQPITYSQRTLLSYSRLFPSLCFGTDLPTHGGDICAEIGDEDVD